MPELAPVPLLAPPLATLAPPKVVLVPPVPSRRANASVVWTKSFYGHVALDSLGNSLLTGVLTGTMDFGGGPLTSRGGADVFVVKLAPGGEHVFSRRFGDASELQSGQAIAFDRWNNVLLGGVFEGTLDFGGGELSLSRHRQLSP